MSSEYYLANVPTDAVYMYVRKRGRSKGPYNWNQMRRLIANGELDEMHELSLDNSQWTPAHRYPILFNPQLSAPDSSEDVVALEGATYGQWFFELDDRVAGPIDFHRLFYWITKDWLDLPARVWTQGHEDWVEVTSLPSFFPPSDTPPPNLETISTS